MPELPEVETTVQGLRNKVLNRTFVDVWTDWEKQIKKPSFSIFKRTIKGKKINNIWRRGKNIVFDLSDDYSLLIHQKMTGHLLYGNWKKEKVNEYIHLKFFLDKGVLVLSDLRKFAKVELWKTKDLLKYLDSLGPEPLEINFKEFKLKKGKIKQVLMNQNVIAGIGNIYSDEILWESKINPFKDASQLTDKELKLIFNNTKKVLKKAVRLKGTSISDYRDVQGEKGFFGKERKAYQRDKCQRCNFPISREKIGGRTASFCPKCQKI